MAFLGKNRLLNRLMSAHQLIEMRVDRHGSAPSGS
jgi:hypothetical protein